MSDPILPLAPIAEGTTQIDIEANDNFLRLSAMSRPCLGVADDEAGGDAEGDVWLVGDTPTGAFATFDEHDIAIFDGTGWHAWAPVEGLRLVVADVRKAWDGADWINDPSIGGGAVDSVNGQTGVVVLDANGVGAATAAQGATADTAVQPGDLAAIATTGDIGDLVGFPGGTTNFLREDGLFAAPPGGGGGGGSPGGSNTQVQYNNSGAFAGDSTFTFDDTTKALGANIVNTAKGSDISRASTTDIWSATGNFVHLTGTTTITSFGANTAGHWRIVRFAGAGTLTNNATSLILPGGANITTAANDTAIVVGEGSSNARVVHYERASGQPIAGASITGWTPSNNTASPNNTVNAARMLAASGSTNADAVIQPKGTGAVMAQLPTATSAGGDKRGGRAVDWQMERDQAADVASGANSVVAGGHGNRAAVAWSTVGGGLYNRVTGGDCGVIAGGNTNVVSGSSAAVGGGQSNTASGECAVVSGGIAGTAAGYYSSVTGGNQCAVTGRYSRAGGAAANDRGVWGADVFASASSMGYGDYQKGGYTLGLSTTDATPGRATTTASGSPSDSNQITLPNNGAYRLKGHAVARQNSTGDTKSWDLAVTIKRGADESTTAIVGSAVVTAVDNDAGASSWTIGLTADTTTGCLAVTVTGQNSKTIKWSIRLDSIEVVG